MFWRNSEGYEDIIGLPHPEPRTHKRMPLENRAAQFAPFAALSGYDDAVCETARVTDARPELCDDAIEMIDWAIRQALATKCRIQIRYFVPDERKAGGHYLSHSGVISRVDKTKGIVTFLDGLSLPLDAVLEVMPESER